MLIYDAALGPQEISPLNITWDEEKDIHSCGEANIGVVTLGNPQATLQSGST